jgi:hypothetical protein
VQADTQAVSGLGKRVARQPALDRLEPGGCVACIRLQLRQTLGDESEALVPGLALP